MFSLWQPHVGPMRTPWILTPWELHENPTRTPWELPENPMRTPWEPWEFNLTHHHVWELRGASPLCMCSTWCACHQDNLIKGKFRLSTSFKCIMFIERGAGGFKIVLIRQYGKLNHDVLSYPQIWACELWCCLHGCKTATLMQVMASICQSLLMIRH